MLTYRRKTIFVVSILFGVSILTLIHRYFVTTINKEWELNLQFSSDLLSERLSGRIQHIIESVEDLGAFLISDQTLPNSDSLNIYSSEIYRLTPGIRALQFVNKDGIIEYTYPLEENENVLGVDLKQMEDWLYLEEARKSKKLVIGKLPVILIQGDQGMIIRKPLFRDNVFLGWAQTVVNINELLLERERQIISGYSIQIIDADGNVIMGSDSITKSAVLRPIKVNDEQWKLIMAPANKVGDFNLIIIIAIWVSGLLIMSIVLWHLYSHWRKEELLNTAVQKRTIELKESEERFRAFFSQAPIGVAQVALDGVFMKVNNALCSMVGYTPEEMLQMRYQDLTPAYEIPVDWEYTRRAISGKEAGFTPIWEKHYIRKDESLIWIITSISVVRDEFYNPLYIISTVADISDLKKAEAELKRTTLELRDLTTRFEKAEEETRKSVASEIHDDLGNRLTAIGLDIDLALKRLSNNNKNIAEPLIEARSELEYVTESTCNIVDGLRPPLLDNYGLSAAVRWNMDKFKQRTGISTSIEVPDLTHRLSDNIQIGLFRILQEALNNIVKHSQADHVSIRLFEDSSNIELLITDNGIGFDYSKINEMPASGHGLVSMRERALAIGGEFTIKSLLDKETVIEVKIELQNG